MFSLLNIKRRIADFRSMPAISVNLMVGAVGADDEYFAKLAREHYAYATRRHRKYLIIQQGVYGVALCALPDTFEKYYYVVEASARRNHKKAGREGCIVERIQFNDHLDAIRVIRQSADTRQGKLMPQSYREGIVKPCTDPVSKSPLHDYAYFGVLQHGKLIGYAGCLIAGEFCGIEHILGHAEYLSVGPVPLLIIGIAAHLYKHYPRVRYYGYGMYFGAGETLRRFKRKFGFVPHIVNWQLGDTLLH